MATVEGSLDDTGNDAIDVSPSENAALKETRDKVILWPPPLEVAPVDPSRKYELPKQEREKLGEILMEEQTSRVVIVTGETCHYRTAARVVPLESRGLEIGCAYGDCLAILSKRCSSVAGIDKSVECINRVRERYPALKADVMDCFVESEALAKAVEGIAVCCLDIGGDRHAEAVFELINNALKDIPILIVKARILYNTAVKVETDQLEEWWHGLCRTGGSELAFPRWAKQQKQQQKKQRKG